jgi:hypothetical protein
MVVSLPLRLETEWQNILTGFGVASTVVLSWLPPGAEATGLCSGATGIEFL